MTPEALNTCWHCGSTQHDSADHPGRYRGEAVEGPKPAATPDVRPQEAGKAPACECPMLDARVDRAYLDGYEQAHREWIACVQDTPTLAPRYAKISEDDIATRRSRLEIVRQNRSVQRAALSAPCPLRAELAELRAEHESAGKRWAKAFIENDSLRAKVDAVRSIADQARLSDRDLRGALEAIDAALREGK